MCRAEMMSPLLAQAAGDAIASFHRRGFIDVIVVAEPWT